MHGISLSQEHLINLNSCTGASEVPSGTVVGIRLLNNLVPSHKEVGYSDNRSGSRACFQISNCRWAHYILTKGSFVGGKVASWGDWLSFGLEEALDKMAEVALLLTN